MRLLMTTDTVGGVWTFTQELAAGLLLRGDSVHLVSLGRLPSPAQREWADGRMQEWGKSFRYTALDTPLEWMPDNQRAYEGGEASLLRICGELDAEAIHSNQFCFGALPVEIPKIVTAHSDVYSWSLCCRGEEMEETPWLRRYGQLVRRGLDQADEVTAPSRWMADWIDRAFRPRHSSVVIPNGRSVPPTQSGPRKLQAVTAGRLWDEAKNIAILAEVDAPMPLLIAGETALESGCAPGFMGRAQMLGPLPTEDLLQLFRESAVYLCTSRYEPFGLAPLEAALCGCAVLASDIPSLREIWGEDALYFTNAASLATLLRFLSRSPSGLRAAQRRSHRRALTYTAERMVNSWQHLFESAIQQQRGAMSCLAASA